MVPKMGWGEVTRQMIKKPEFHRGTTPSKEVRHDKILRLTKKLPATKIGRCSGHHSDIGFRFRSGAEKGNRNVRLLLVADEELNRVTS